MSKEDIWFKAKVIIISLIFVMLFFILFRFLTIKRVLAVIFLLSLFFLCDYYFKIGFNKSHYFLVSITLILGLIFSPLYEYFFYYDKILHLVMPFIACFISFYFVDRKIKTKSLFTKLLLTFAIVFSIIALLEVYEYFSDVYLGTRLQGVYLRIGSIDNVIQVMSKLEDTIIDLALGVLSWIIFSYTKLFSALFIQKRKI